MSSLRAEFHRPDDRIGWRMVVLIAVYCCTCYSAWILDNETFYAIATEDGPFENLAAAYLLFSAVIFLILHSTSRQRTVLQPSEAVPQPWYLSLACLFFFGFGEEISWGQRIYDFPLPEIWRKINVQNDLTVHNLSLFNPYTTAGEKKPFWQQLFTFNAAYAYFTITFCVLSPVLRRFSEAFRQLSNRVRLPIVPIEIGIVFLVTYIIDKGTMLLLIDRHLRYPNEEIREHIWAFLFFITSVCWMHDRLGKSDQESSGQQSDRKPA